MMVCGSTMADKNYGQKSPAVITSLKKMDYLNDRPRLQHYLELYSVAKDLIETLNAAEIMGNDDEESRMAQNSLNAIAPLLESFAKEATHELMSEANYLAAKIRDPALDDF